MIEYQLLEEIDKNQATKRETRSEGKGKELSRRFREGQFRGLGVAALGGYECWDLTGTQHCHTVGSAMRNGQGVNTWTCCLLGLGLPPTPMFSVLLAYIMLQHASGYDKFLFHRTKHSCPRICSCERFGQIFGLLV